jgi:hypothetical protein
MTKTPKKTKSEYGTPDLSDWDLQALDDAIDGFSNFLRKSVDEAVEHALNDEDTGVDWPAIWGKGDGRTKKAKIDPLTIYFTVAIGDGDDGHPVRSFNLRDALQSEIESCRDDGSYSDGLAQIRDALIALVSEITAAIDSAPHE